MLFKDFLLSCSNSEELHIYIKNNSAIKGLASDFILNDKLANKVVNQFFSWCEGKNDGLIYETYIEVYLK